MLDIAQNGMQQEEAEQALASASFLDAVNLDEVSTDTLTLSFVEYKSEQYTDEGGETRTRRKPYARRVELSNRVPMKVLNNMLKSRQVLERKEGELDPEMLNFMIEQVLTIWKLSEPDMTRERLEDGLDNFKIVKLFTLFFTQLSRLNANKA